MSVTRKAASTFALVALAGALLLPPSPLAAQQAPAARSAHAPAAECLDCHEELRAVIERAFPHEPAYEEDCALCHSPHAARYPKLLNARERALCSSCHRDTVVSFQKASIHTPVKEGRCTVCHAVHGADHEGLLVSEGNELCLSCHEYQKSQISLPTVHEPFVEGECSDCHDPHASDHPGQLAAPANALCGLCHEAGAEEVVEAHYGIPVEGSNCKGCHDPHGSIQSGLLLPLAHEPFAEGSCDMCHATESETPQLLRATGSRLCQTCHQDYPPKAAHVHAPAAEGQCAACHTPHASRAAALMDSGLEETCMTCHADLRTRAEEARSAHPTTFEDGSSCDACHRPHGGDDELFLVAGAIRTCLNCHETQRHGHPLGDDQIDPRTGRAITCVTCHSPHGTPFPQQLVGERTRGLCVQCHDGNDKGDARSRR